MSESSTSAPQRFVVGVRELAEFTARSGDLDLRWSPSPTAAEGLAGHERVRRRRGPGYEPELPLALDCGLLTVRGRADGYDGALERLEEIKTYRGRFDGIGPAQQSLHWAQAQLYGHLLCQLRGLPHIELALVYFNVDDEQETVLLRRAQAGELAHFFRQQCEQFLGWAQQELAHRQQRSQALQALAFPLPPLRPGQRELAEAVWRTLRAGRSLMVQAPTGIGKTLGTLFPSLKALGSSPERPLDKIVYLSAKSSGRHLALSSLRTLRVATDAPAPQPLRVLELMAREKSCEHPDKACHGASCPLACGFYDRLPQARAQAVHEGWLDATALRRIALAHQVCPYHLGRDLIAWADVVVGDYNHWFDPHAVVYALAVSRGWRIGLLVDEAHNLVERGRQMYSVEIRQTALALARAQAPQSLKRHIGRLQRQLQRLADDDAAYTVMDALPRGLHLALQGACAQLAAWQAAHPEAPPGPVQQLGFELNRFLQQAEQAQAHSLIDLSIDPQPRPDVRLGVRNVVPAPFLRPRLQAAQASVLFSATLTPAHHYQQLLGLPDDGIALDLPAPFRSDQLQVRVLSSVSTRWADRSRSLPALVDVLAAQWQAQPGNYLAFFSSFDYLRQASAALQARYPQLPQWQQGPGMDEERQRAFVERFRTGPSGIAFAVLGGSFAEGIDLPGEQLIGAFIATLGLPQVNAMQEELRRRLQELLGQGYAHTYLYPGLRKVVQAAGRIIRSPADRGVLYLMDERYLQPQIRALLPRWWQPERFDLPTADPVKASPAAALADPALVQSR